MARDNVLKYPKAKETQILFVNHWYSQIAIDSWEVHHYTQIYHLFLFTRMYGSQWGSLAAARSLWKAAQVTRESISVLQVMRESVSGTTSHVCSSECAMNEIKGSCDKIIITIVPSYTRKSFTCLLPLVILLMLCTCNIRWQYFPVWLCTYGDTYIILLFKVIVLMTVWRSIVKLVIQFFSGLVPEMFTNSFLLYVPLTSVCCIHSNVYGLGDIHCIRYLTAVDPFLSASNAV